MGAGAQRRLRDELGALADGARRRTAGVRQGRARQNGRGVASAGVPRLLRRRGAVHPELLGWQDGEQTLLAIADLSDAYWPPPWTAEQIEAVCVALDELHATPPPQALPSIAEERD